MEAERKPYRTGFEPWFAELVRLAPGEQFAARGAGEFSRVIVQEVGQCIGGRLSRQIGWEFDFERELQRV
jgi:hypothetical protein